MKKKSIRTGMKVRSVYDPDRIFTIDRSKKPSRIFHEKGSSRWYGAFELQSVSERPMKLSSAAKQTALAKRSEALRGMPPASFPQSPTQYSRTCLECGVEFTTKKKKAKFCSGPHRSRYHKRMNETVAVQTEPMKIPVRLRSEPEKDELPAMRKSLADA